MSEAIKYMDITEFMNEGFLQEANRLFFHPLGLALEVIIDEDKKTKLGNIWDYRDDPEGNFFGNDMISEEKIKKVLDLKNSKRFARLMKAREYGLKINGDSVQEKVSDD